MQPLGPALPRPDPGREMEVHSFGRGRAEAGTQWSLGSPSWSVLLALLSCSKPHVWRIPGHGLNLLVSGLPHSSGCPRDQGLSSPGNHVIPGVTSLPSAQRAQPRRGAPFQPFFLTAPHPIACQTIKNQPTRPYPQWCLCAQVCRDPLCGSHPSVLTLVSQRV